MIELDRLLAQAEAQQDADEWEILTKYRRNDIYVDDDGAVNISGRRIDTIRENISVQGENNSQYIEFIMDRYYDGIDIAEQTLAIHYEVGDASDEDAPINVYKNDTQIKFGWVVESNLTQYETTIEFCIWARGTLEDGSAYVLKTLPQRYEIKRGLEIASGIIEPSNNWYTQFALNMDQKVAQASENADRAEQAASSVDGIVETVTTARDEVTQKASTVDAQHSEVGAWHHEAEQFRNEAEQFRNQAEAITGIGLAEEGKPGIVQPDGVTTKVDENGKLIVTSSGTTDYQALENKPSIAGVELSGDKSYDDLGLASKDGVTRSFETVNQNIKTLDTFTKSLDEDISTLDEELEVVKQDLQSMNSTVEGLETEFADLKPHAFSNPTNNLLATVAGTPLDAVQGKVLYDRDIDMSVGRLAFQNKNAFGTLEEFVQETAKDINTPIIARLRDTTGAWGPGGNIQWYKCLLAYQNPYGSQYSLGGAGFMWDDAGNKWSIEITGNSNTGIVFKHDKVVVENELNSIIKTKFNHKEYIPWTSIASGSYAAGEKRYTKTDIGLIKELIFVFQENSVYESMAYEYVSITTGYGNLTTGYYQAQTTKGLFRIYYSEEGYIDIREVPSGLGIRAALYLSKI